MCRFREIGKGTTICDPVFLKDYEVRKAKNGNPFISMTLVDEDKQSIKACFFDREEDDLRVQKRSVVSVKLQCKEYDGSRVFNVLACEPSKKGKTSDFEKNAPIPTDTVFSVMRQMTDTMPVDLKSVLQYILDKNRAEFCSWQSSMVASGAYAGGLIFHTYRMLVMALSAAKVYSDIDKDLLVAGVICHDIGRLREISPDPAGNVKFTVSGNLLGRTMLGVKMIDEACAATNTPFTDRIMGLEHIVASHQLRSEWGAAVTPATPEAILVASLDYLDNKIGLCEEALTGVNEGCCSDQRVPFLGGFVYKADQAKTV